MVMITKTSGNVNQYINEYVVDYIADLKDIKSAKEGSAALCLEDKEVYILNSKQEWQKV